MACCINRYFAIFVYQSPGPNLDKACLTDLSASPLLEGWKGAVRMCLMPCPTRYSSNGPAVNYGPLSDTRVSGMSYLANRAHSALLKASAVVEAFSFTSTHFE